MYYGNYRFLPAPLMTYSVDHQYDDNDDLLFKITTYDLAGTLLFPSGDFTTMMDMRQQLEDALGSGNQLFLIENDEGTPLTSGYPFIESIVFDEGVWVDRINYSATLTVEESLAASGAVESFTETWGFEENEDRETISVSHSVAAVGINTDGLNNATENAKNYVLSRVGYTNAPSFLPAYTEGSGALSDYASFRSESVNIVDHEYEIQETFVLSPYKYTHDNSATFSVDDVGVITVEIEGTIQGLGRGVAAINNARYGWTQIEPTVIETASGVYLRYGGTDELPVSPGSQSIAEDEENGTVNYSFSYEEVDQVLPSGITDFTMTKDISEPTTLYASHTIVNKADGPVVQDLGTTSEGTVTINGTATRKSDLPLSDLKTYISDRISAVAPSSYSTTYRITEETYNIDETSKTIEFTVTWTFTAPIAGGFLSYLS